MNQKTVFFVIASFMLFAGTKDLEAQTYSIGHMQETFVDPAREDRPVLTEIYFPIPEGGNNAAMAEGTFLLIIFGHGFVMTWSAYENLWTHFVPRGYIMAFPRTEGGFSPSHHDFGLDMAFLANTIQALGQEESSLFYQNLNGLTAVMGHSMGGGAAVLAASYNQNINALLALAPAETNPSAIEAAQLVNRPSLIFSGSSDDVTPASVHQIPIYENLGTPCRTYVSITGGGHCYFANFNFNCNLGELGSSGNITLTREEQQQITADFAAPWLDYFLKGDCDQWEPFSDSLHTSPRITFMQDCIIEPPGIFLSGDTLFSTPATTYQWFLNEEPIAGATDNLYLPSESGNYQVAVTYFTQCPWVSEPLTYLVQFSVALSAEPEEGGSVMMLTDPPFFEGDTVEVGAVPSEDFAFLHWEEQGDIVSYATEYSFIIERDRNLIARFEETATYISRPDEEEIIVFPVPARETLHIKLPESHHYNSIYLMSMEGQLLIRKTAGPSQTYRLSTKGLSAGVYQLLFQGNEGTQSVRILVK